MTADNLAIGGIAIIDRRYRAQTRLTNSTFGEYLHAIASAPFPLGEGAKREPDGAKPQ